MNLLNLQFASSTFYVPRGDGLGGSGNSVFISMLLDSSGLDESTFTEKASVDLRLIG